MRSRLLGAVCAFTRYAVGILTMLIAASVNASPVIDTEPNNSIATAQNIVAAFSLTADINIDSSFSFRGACFMVSRPSELGRLSVLSDLQQMGQLGAENGKFLSQAGRKLLRLGMGKQ